MSTLGFGIPFDSSVGLVEFVLPETAFLIWRDGLKPEAVLCQNSSHIPSGWTKDSGRSWKILGKFDLIKNCFPGFHIPAGSKVISLESEAVIQLDFSSSSVRFNGKRKKRLVIVDDSSTIRKLLKHVISQFDGWEVVAEVEKAEDIPKAISDHYPDLITLDLHLGEINGLQAMKNFIAPKKIPTLLITSQPKNDGSLVMDTLEAGALDYLQKPEASNWKALEEDLLHKMDAALKSKWINKNLASKSKAPLNILDYDPEKYLIAIGSSTGGTQALQEILTQLPERIPPILITQHIPAGFSKALADRLNNLCPFEVKEAEDGDEVRPGRVLIAPGDHHLLLTSGGKRVEILNSEPVNRFRPSVEVMFDSVSKNAKKKVIAVMLTGMGKDGAQAMLGLKQNGAITIAQDEASCVVFGMPKEAIRLGAAIHIKSLNDIPEFLTRLCKA